jgi:RimJ/RimL family protein N-acetyltransferase
MTKAVRKIIEICFIDLQLNRVQLYMSVNNHASKKIAEKVGAKLEGIMRERIVREDKIEDAYLYSVIKSDL